MATALSLGFFLPVCLLLGWTPASTWDDLLPGGGSPVEGEPIPGRLAVGVTHGQYSADDWGDRTAVRRARSLLQDTVTLQNQHIHGWGALNPNPAPGEFDWASLDRRMELIAESGGTPVITLCCAPDWMKGGAPGQTDWSTLQRPPDPEYYDDFAELAATVAGRYPQVRYYQVWNELKGFWLESENRWDYEAYTALYNAVYDALKSVDPTLRIGGPYVVLELWQNPHAGGFPSTLVGRCGTVDQRSLDVIDYWMEHKHGADFLSVDASALPRDAAGSPTSNADFFGFMTRWLHSRTGLPVWWSEFYVGNRSLAIEESRVARNVAALLQMVDANAAVGLIWQPQQAHLNAETVTAVGLWSSTETPGGGQTLPYGRAVGHIAEILSETTGGRPAVATPLPHVYVLVGTRGALLVNDGDEEVNLTLGEEPVTLRPYDIRYEPTPSPILTVQSLGRAVNKSDQAPCLVDVTSEPEE